MCWKIQHLVKTFWFKDGILTVSYMAAQRGSKLSCDSFKGTNPIHEDSNLMT